MTPDRASPTAATGDAGAESIRFLVKLARGLHMYGTPAHRIERALEIATGRLGIPSQFFSLPTVILASFGSPDERSTGLIRVAPGTNHLEKLVLLDEVMQQLLRGAITPEDAARRVDAIEAMPQRWNGVVTTLAYSVASACAASFFAAGMKEVALALLLGALPGLFALLSCWRAGFARIHEALSAIVVAFLALIAARLVPGTSSSIVTVSSLIVLLPGLSLTMAILELAAQSLVSGTVRLVSAAVVLVELTFGVALARAAGDRLFPGSAHVHAEAQSLPAWSQLVALLIAPFAFTVLFRARPRDALPILGAGVLGFAGARLGAHFIDPDLGGFVGAFVVGIASNLYSRLRDRPVAVTLLPGILLLVPGSVGFRGLMSLLERDIVSGVDTAFRMVLVAAAIVAGLLFANVAVPARRAF